MSSLIRTTVALLLIATQMHTAAGFSFLSKLADYRTFIASLTNATTVPGYDHLAVLGPCPPSRCASTLSMCLITDACRCKLPKRPDIACPCCEQCARCLGSLFTQCCGCVEMCAIVNATATAAGATDTRGMRVKPDSVLSDVPAPVGGLFESLTEKYDDSWTTLTFPVGSDPLVPPQTDDWDMVVLAADGDGQQPIPDLRENNLFRGSSAKSTGGPNATEGIDTVVVIEDDVNVLRRRRLQASTAPRYCTVAYSVPCMSLRRCRQHCAEMAATGVRWFYDGCCQCVGRYCLDYGVDESRCEDCPLVTDPMVGVKGVIGELPDAPRSMPDGWTMDDYDMFGMEDDEEYQNRYEIDLDGEDEDEEEEEEEEEEEVKQEEDEVEDEEDDYDDEDYEEEDDEDDEEYPDEEEDYDNAESEITTEATFIEDEVENPDVDYIIEESNFDDNAGIDANDNVEADDYVNNDNGADEDADADYVIAELQPKRPQSVTDSDYDMEDNEVDR